MASRTVLPLAALSMACTAAQASNLTTLHSFGTTGGAAPIASLMKASNGYFYGTTDNANAGKQIIYRVDSLGIYKSLYTFTGGADGGSPGVGALVQAGDGNLYGTTEEGGAYGYGTVYRISLSGSFSTIHSFTGTDGGNPEALTVGSDGNLYGISDSGGAGCCGTVFRMTLDGVVTTLHSFVESDGLTPNAALVQGADGYFYGSNFSGGANQSGNIFKISTTGSFTILHSFSALSYATGRGVNSDGSCVDSPLAFGTDGNLYGAAFCGGTTGNGTIFKITPSGGFTLLHTLSNTDGSTPNGMTLASDGNFYGVTYGTYGVGTVPYEGTIFKVTPTGTYSTLYSFTGADGEYPESGLVFVKGLSTTGYFYGITEEGGASNEGTVFKFSTPVN